MPHSAISAILGSLLLLQIKEPVTSGTCWKIVSHGCEGLSAISFAAEAPRIWIGKIFLFEAVETGFFCLFKSEFPLNVKIKCQHFKGK